MSRLVTDAANKLYTTEKTIVFRAAKLEGRQGVDARFRELWSEVEHGKKIPDVVENYCIDVLAGREPKLHSPPCLTARPASVFSHIPIH